MADRENFSVGTLTVNKILGAGLPIQMFRKAYYVDPANGSNGNVGDRIDFPYQTIAKAYARCESGKHDVVVVLGGATADTFAAAMDWAKDETHLIGIGGRAKINIAADGAISPILTVSGNGCVIANIEVDNPSSDTTALIAVLVSGDSNKFSNCTFDAVGHADVGDETGARDLKITGSHNSFEDCVFGNCLINRSVANAVIEFTDGGDDTKFDNCIIKTKSDNAGVLHIDAAGAAGDIATLALFRNCTFYNLGTTMTEAIAAHATLTGDILMVNCPLQNVTDWENPASGNSFGYGPTAAGATVGLAVANAAS